MGCGKQGWEGPQGREVGGSVGAAEGGRGGGRPSSGSGVGGWWGVEVGKGEGLSEGLVAWDMLGRGLEGAVREGGLGFGLGGWGAGWMSGRESAVEYSTMRLLELELRTWFEPGVFRRATASWASV